MHSAIAAIARLITQHKTFVLTTHVNPDGDGLGSEVALAEWLSSRGKHVSVLNHSTTPANYLFLDPNNHIATFDAPRDSAKLASADVILILDMNQPDRLRSMEQSVLSSRAVRVCIDHHLEPAPFADHYLIDDQATSTGELTYHLLVHLNGKALDPLVAQALYCAILTDTGSFRYSYVDPDIHRIVAHLIECGADPEEVYNRVYNQWTPGRVQLLGEVLATLATAHAGALAHITVTREMLKRTGTLESDTDNFTTYPMSIRGVNAGILFVEAKDGVKVSFRSRGDIPINELAKEFGGNGHRNAAGAHLYNESLDEAKRVILAAAKKYLREPQPTNKRP